jgi:hypothetical protein
MPPDPADTRADRLEFSVDPAAPVGDLVPILARLLRRLRDQRGLPVEETETQEMKEETQSV